MSQLLNKVRGVCKVQDEERDSKFNAVMKKTPTFTPNMNNSMTYNQFGSEAMDTSMLPDPPSHHPKLKDYLNSRKLAQKVSNDPQAVGGSVGQSYGTQPYPAAQTYGTQQVPGTMNYATQPIPGAQSYGNQSIQGVQGYSNQPASGAQTYAVYPISGASSYGTQASTGSAGPSYAPQSSTAAVANTYSMQSSTATGATSYTTQPINGSVGQTYAPQAVPAAQTQPSYNYPQSGGVQFQTPADQQAQNQPNMISQSTYSSQGPIQSYLSSYGKMGLSEGHIRSFSATPSIQTSYYSYSNYGTPSQVTPSQSPAQQSPYEYNLKQHQNQPLQQQQQPQLHQQQPQSYQQPQQSVSVAQTYTPQPQAAVGSQNVTQPSYNFSQTGNIQFHAASSQQTQSHPSVITQATYPSQGPIQSYLTGYYKLGLNQGQNQSFSPSSANVNSYYSYNNYGTPSQVTPSQNPAQYQYNYESKQQQQAQGQPLQQQQPSYQLPQGGAGANASSQYYYGNQQPQFYNTEQQRGESWAAVPQNQQTTQPQQPNAGLAVASSNSSVPLQTIFYSNQPSNSDSGMMLQSQTSLQNQSQVPASTPAPTTAPAPVIRTNVDLLSDLDFSSSGVAPPLAPVILHGTRGSAASEPGNDNANSQIPVPVSNTHSQDPDDVEMEQSKMVH